MPLSKTRETEKRRAELVALCLSLPSVEVSGDEHLVIKVRKKTFAYYMFDHHGDGKVALCCKAPPGEARKWAEEDPTQFSVESVLGSKGWATLRLDLAAIDWDLVERLIVTAYRLVAPKKLIAAARLL